jgi:hypothetical protein
MNTSHSIRLMKFSSLAFQVVCSTRSAGLVPPTIPSTVLKVRKDNGSVLLFALITGNASTVDCLSASLARFACRVSNSSMNSSVDVEPSGICIRSRRMFRRIGRGRGRGMRGLWRSVLRGGIVLGSDWGCLFIREDNVLRGGVLRGGGRLGGMMGMLYSIFCIMFCFMFWAGLGEVPRCSGAASKRSFPVVLFISASRWPSYSAICLLNTSCLLRLIPAKYSFFASLMSIFLPEPHEEACICCRNLCEKSRRYRSNVSEHDVHRRPFFPTGAFHKDRTGQSSVARSSEHRILCCWCTRREGKI